MDAHPHLPDPKAIYQEHLDALSAALLSGNFSAFAARMALPCRIITEAAERVFSTRDELASAFFSMSRNLKSQSVTDHVRIATAATYVSETRICGSHVTHILRDGKRLTQPYPNRIRLELIDGKWLETVAAHALLTDPAKITMPKVAAQPHLPEMNEYDPERTPQ
ncbi:hypothetical protein C8N43_1788 [Litoreibacter ponti]|uniref:Uncharacterized protein n=1 Tax=Litoreibacter ponti TaxID=1510457 RepID=A0A2T6BM47_9RHOB|nr:hypothetical protein [Litoreibacter ponti]PTX57122.1 hypothetical protein C8N43_1788 [Litoreibacter ponti]